MPETTEPVAFPVYLTNGTETFRLWDVSNGHGSDGYGAGYTRCEIQTCDHAQAPVGSIVWHDDEHTETLWENPDSMNPTQAIYLTHVELTILVAALHAVKLPNMGAKDRLLAKLTEVK